MNPVGARGSDTQTIQKARHEHGQEALSLAAPSLGRCKGSGPPRAGTALRRDQGATRGFFVIECESLDQALEAAADIPSVRYGGKVEVRPIVEQEQR